MTNDNVSNVVIGYECLSSCILTHLAAKKHIFCPADEFFIGEGFKVTFDRKDKHQIKLKMYQSNFTFLHKIGADYKVRRLSKENHIIELKKMLKKGKCISIKGSSHLLDYHVTFKQVEPMIHYLNVTHYDADLDMYYIVDSYIPTHKKSSFTGWVQIESIESSWASMNYEYIEILIPDELNVTAYQESDLLKGISEYLKGGRDVKNNQYFGLEATLNFFEELSLVALSRDRLLNFAKNINYNMKVFGFLPSKEILLEKMYSLDEDLANRYKDLIKAMVSTSTMFVRHAILKKTDAIAIFKEKFTNLIEAENEVFNDLIKKYEVK